MKDTHMVFLRLQFNKMDMYDVSLGQIPEYCMHLLGNMRLSVVWHCHIIACAVFKMPNDMYIG